MNGMINFFISYLKEQKEIIIYGCGNNGRFLHWFFCQQDIHISYWCDGNQELWNKRINGIQCISPYQLLEHSQAVLIVSMEKYEEVMPQLTEFEFSKIFTWADVKNLKIELQDDKVLLKQYRKWILEQMPDIAAILDRNQRYKNKHSGERCFIVGNGPSIREQDLSLLGNEMVFTVNQIARNPQFYKLNTNYHLWADPDFFKTELVCEGDYQLLRIMKQLPKDTECFFPYHCAVNYINKFELYNDININYYSSSELVNEEEEIDFTEFIRNGSTVVQYAIRLAIYMGFKEIYLLGCECTTILNVINARTAQYTTVTHGYDIDENEKERARHMYFSLPMEEYYRSECGIMTEYRLIGNYCRRKGIKLVNCTPGGLLEEFPRIEYESIFDCNTQ